MADGMSAKFMKNAFVGWTFTAGTYYPPDFDASKLVPLKHLKPKGQDKMMNIRMMFPFTMVCDSCGEYNYTGTKFTAKVEQIKGESYLGLKVYRFYARCRHCWAEVTFKTDPKHSDYTMESGGKRTYEAWKDADQVEAEIKKEQEKERESDRMKALEQKSVDVQAEMQRIEDLDAIRTMNKRLGAREQCIEEALEFLFKKKDAEENCKEPLREGDAAELEGFREAKEEQRRRRLDDEVDGEASAASAPPSTGAAAIVAAAAAAGKVGASKESGRGPGVGARLSFKRRALAPAEGAGGEKRLATGTDDVGQEGAAGSGGPKASDNGAASSSSLDTGAVASSTAQDTGAASSSNAQASGAAASSNAPASSAGGGLGLGAYESDSS